MSPDGVASHAAFRDKYRLHDVPLLADEGHAVCEAYAVWTGTGVRRQTFVVAPDGTVEKHYPKVDTATHAAQILADLAAT